MRQVWRFADAAVIGSAIVNEIQTLGDSPDLVKRVGEFVRSLIAPITDQPLVEQSPRAKIR